MLSLSKRNNLIIMSSQSDFSDLIFKIISLRLVVIFQIITLLLKKKKNTVFASFHITTRFTFLVTT